jgi:hypothetical protein
MNKEINIQDSKELQYFQKIQVQNLMIKKLMVEIGKLKSEVDHLNYLLKKSYEPATNSKKWKRKYDDLLYLTIRKLHQHPGASDEEINHLLTKL